MKHRLDIALWRLIGFSALILPLTVWAAESPKEIIRVTVDQAIAVLQDPALQGPHHRQVRIDKVRALVFPRFDAEELAKRSLGLYWRERSPEERQEFIRLFAARIEHSHSSTLDRYTSGVQVFLDQERLDGDFTEVNTRILDPTQDRTFTIDYRMRQAEGRWLIYDVVVENVSLVQNYRNQFNRILGRSSFADLLQTLKNRVQELDATSAS
jgi:phospholipid transport system substrate-binding protein